MELNELRTASNDVDRKQGPATASSPDVDPSEDIDDECEVHVVDFIDDDSGLTSINSSNERVDTHRTEVVRNTSKSHRQSTGIDDLRPILQSIHVDATRRRSCVPHSTDEHNSMVDRQLNVNQLRVVDDDYSALIAKRGRLFAARQTRRLILKNGDLNVTSVGITKRRRMYLADMFTTLVEMRWSYQVIFFMAQFMITWVLFGLVYYVIAVSRGDITNTQNSTWVPCVMNIYDFSSAVMFSMETQTTMGYGVRVPDPECQIGMFVVMIQSCVGTFIQVLATGIVFAKISQPTGRAKTLMFSRNAVICLRDGLYQLVFRVGDMRHKSHIIGTSIRALMVRNRLTAEGEFLPMCQYPLALDNETSPVDDDYVFMAWPVTVVHKIDETSPLWDISAEQLITEQFEIIVILEGTVESTGSSTQVRTSYLPSEIEWGQRLAPLITYKKENGCYKIDYRHFHSTFPISMPDFSAKSWSTCHLTLNQPVDDHQADFTIGVVEPVPRGWRIVKDIFRRRGLDARGFEATTNSVDSDERQVRVESRLDSHGLEKSDSRQTTASKTVK